MSSPLAPSHSPSCNDINQWTSSLEKPNISFETLYSNPVIDDINNVTLVSATSNEKLIKSEKKKKSELSMVVAEKIAEKAKEKNINKIYFDRGIYKYHGRIKIFAETLRKKGIEF